jgi:dihydropyrimidine dehydrogenase (NAD+) subunit PreT
MFAIRRGRRLEAMSVTHSPSTSLPNELRPPLGDKEAVLEAERCLVCSGPYAVAPCTMACPAGVDVPGFVDALAQQDVVAAAQTIFAENILGGTCARVCPVEVLCQGACVLAREGQEPIRIAALQRHATDWALVHELPLRPAAALTGRSVAVVGAGPAGLACAGELAARGHAVTVFEGHDEIGGLVRSAIAPYRIERDPLPAEQRALEALGVRFRLGTVVSCVDALTAYDAVFLGVGLGDDVPLELPGDDLAGIWESLRFIEALKDGELRDIGDRVVVIGGGNTAIDVARESRRLGARHVTVAYRRTRAAMPAYAFEVEDAEREGVVFAWRTLPVRFLGEQQVEAVECVSVRLAPSDTGGRRRPVPVAGTEFNLRADTVVKAVGQRPRPELSGRFGGLQVSGGKIVVDDDGRTTNRRVFAGGDAVNGGASVVEAVCQGKRAALAIDRSLT